MTVMSKNIPQPNTDPAYLADQGLSKTTPQRFLSKIRICEKTECWIWLGFIHDGYGYMSRGTKVGLSIKSAIVSWILFHGPVPNGLHILHKCPHGHNKACVNPEHLKPGTRSENMRDVIAAGNHYFSNHPTPKGEKNPSAKLTKEQRDEIRRLYASGEMTQIPLAKKFGVVQGTIWNVLHEFDNLERSGPQ